MAYQKNEWKSGDVVTSAKLNNLESGSCSVYRFTRREGSSMYDLNASWNDIHSRFENGIPVFAVMPAETEGNIFMTIAINAYMSGEDDYAVSFVSDDYNRVGRFDTYPSESGNPDSPLMVGFD